LVQANLNRLQTRFDVGQIVLVVFSLVEGVLPELQAFDSQLSLFGASIHIAHDLHLVLHNVEAFSMEIVTSTHVFHPIAQIDQLRRILWILAELLQFRISLQLP